MFFIGWARMATKFPELCPEKTFTGTFAILYAGSFSVFHAIFLLNILNRRLGLIGINVHAENIKNDNHKWCSSLLVNLSKKQFYAGQKRSMCVYASSYDCFLDKFTRRLETPFTKQYYYEL